MASAIRFAAAPLLFLALAAPCFRFAYVSDDLTFLNRALSFRPHDLLPHPHSAFYRPLSREVYFAFINFVLKADPFLAHVANATGAPISSANPRVRTFSTGSPGATLCELHDW